MMKTRLLILLLSLLAFNRIVTADSKKYLDKPLMLGPQYPLLFLSTTFEPDTAFLLTKGDFFVASSYALLNTYVYSSNSAKAYDETAAASEFQSTASKGYSVYMDGEMDHRFFKVYYGLSDSIEIQLSYQDFRFFPGSLDGAIENFHKTFNIDNQGRDNTAPDLLEIFIYDNETNKTVFALTNASSRFIQQSMTLGLKLALKETASEAISISLASNFGDYYIERELNEASSDTEQPAHRNFNDYNVTLRYSSLFDSWSLHTAFSASFVKESLLEKSPDVIYYFFLGGNWHIGENWDFILQALDYSSPFPKDQSTISEDIREISMGLRWFVFKDTVWEVGFVENQSQGPQNIDIAFFSNLMFYL